MPKARSWLPRCAWGAGGGDTVTDAGTNPTWGSHVPRESFNDSCLPPLAFPRSETPFYNKCRARGSRSCCRVSPPLQRCPGYKNPDLDNPPWMWGLRVLDFAPDVRLTTVFRPRVFSNTRPARVHVLSWGIANVPPLPPTGVPRP